LPRNRGQRWSTFLRNHLHQTWACDFLTLITLRFEILYCFVVVDLARREIVHIGVTPSPSAQFAGQSFVEAVADRNLDGKDLAGIEALYKTDLDAFRAKRTKYLLYSR
jgi:hypothetical protein